MQKLSFDRFRFTLLFIVLYGIWKSGKRKEWLTFEEISELQLELRIDKRIKGVRDCIVKSLQ